MMAKDNEPKDLVSVIIPVYNTSNDFLVDCLNSVKSQTYRNIEIIIVDDGSKMETANYLDSFEGGNVKVFHKKGGGVSSARNFGVLNAKGQYICFVDSDDCIHPFFVEQLYKDINKNNVLISACNLQKTKEPTIQEEQKNVSSTHKYESNDIWHHVNTGYCVTKMYNRLIFDNFLFDESISMCEDALFVNTVLNSIGECCSTDYVLYYYRDNPNGSSHLARADKYLQGINVSKQIMEFEHIREDKYNVKIFKEFQAVWQFKYMLALAKEDYVLNKEKIREEKSDYINNLLPNISVTREKRVRFINRLVKFPNPIFIILLLLGNKILE